MTIAPRAPATSSQQQTNAHKVVPLSRPARWAMPCLVPLSFVMSFHSAKTAGAPCPGRMLARLYTRQCLLHDDSVELLRTDWCVGEWRGRVIGRVRTGHLVRLEQRSFRPCQNDVSPALPDIKTD